PPVHYLEIGELMRLGIGLPYAEALPSTLLLLLALGIAATARYSAVVKVGLMYGIFASVTGFGGLQLDQWMKAESLDGLRPDIHVTLAWISGLLLLEAARLRSWPLWQVVLGSFLVTYASGVHYFGVVAWTGLA